MKSIKQIGYDFKHSMQYSLANSTHQFVAVGFIIFFGFPLCYWLWSEGSPPPYENLWLRLLGSFFGLGLILTPYWPKWGQEFKPWYWFLSLLYFLSFFLAYTFLINPVSVISSMSLLCGVFLLVLLVDIFSLIVLLSLGWSLAFLCYYLESSPVPFGEAHFEMSLLILLVVIAGSTLNYKTATLHKQRLAGMAAAAGMIAHELRTPLLGMKSGVQALNNFMPQLFSAYRLAKEHGLLSTTIREHRLAQLEGVSERVIQEIDHANTIIDMLLIKAAQENALQHCVLEECRMADCLKEAIARYPFRSSGDKDKVSWKGDFVFMGSKLLMQHVLFNLIKNALYAIAIEQRGELNLWTESSSRHHYLFIKDTAKGMSADQLSYLFKHFYTTTFMGTGLGLSFCKLVMQRFGGDIHCESVQGEHTTFILSFPRLAQEV